MRPAFRPRATRRSTPRRVAGAAVAVVLVCLVTPASGQAAPPRTQEIGYLQMSDGVMLSYCLLARPGASPQPTVVTFTDYEGPDVCAGDNVSVVAFNFANFLRVNLRGTGRSGGAFDGFGGPRDQQDMYEVIDWLAAHPAANGKIAINGNSGPGVLTMMALQNLHPAVDTVLVATAAWDQYRDLAYPGGVHNAGLVPVYGALVGRGYVNQAPAGVQAGTLDPLGPAAYASWMASVAGRATEDDFWRARSVADDAEAGEITIPILFQTGWLDVISNRGVFEAYWATRDNGSMITLYGGHDGGAPVAGPYGADLARRWLRRYLLDECNQINPHDNLGCRAVADPPAPEPPIHLFLPEQGRVGLLDDRGLLVNAADWPVPATQWQRLYLGAERSQTADSVNDGSLVAEAGPATTAPVPLAAPPPLLSDPRFAVWLVDRKFDTDQRRSERAALTFTSAPFTQDMVAAGPVTARLFLTAGAPEADLYVRVTDVAPDGSSTFLTSGLLRASHPLDLGRSVGTDGRPSPATTDAVARAWHDHSRTVALTPGQVGEHLVEVWPVGNVFKAGHRLRVTLSAPPGATSAGVAASAHLLHMGGAQASSVLVPFVPVSSLSPPTPLPPPDGGGTGGGGTSGAQPPEPSPPGEPAPARDLVASGAGRVPRRAQPGTFVAFSFAVAVRDGVPRGTLSFRDSTATGERADVAGTVTQVLVAGDTVFVRGTCRVDSTEVDEHCEIVAKDAATPGVQSDVVYVHRGDYAEVGKLAAGEVAVTVLSE